MAKNSAPHDGHRQRMLKKFLDHGIGVFEEHEMLEILLFPLLPRINTNEIAHNLINKFGSLKAVIMHAQISEMQDVKGIGQNTATFLNFFGALTEYISHTKEKIVTFDSSTAIVKYCTDYFRNMDYECAAYFLLDDKMSLIFKEDINLKKQNQTEIDYNRIIRQVVYSECYSIVLAHNHPIGSICASNVDITSTRTLADYLKPLNVKITDHIIVQNGHGYSMRSSGEAMEIWY